MPYTRASVAKHNRAAAASGKSAAWTKIANNALRTCKASGKGDCDAYSIRVANAMVKRVKESSDFLLEAGRVLSAKNEARLNAAIEEINAILALVKREEEGDVAEALAPELVAYLEANPEIVVEISDLLGEALLLDEADYATGEVPTKDEVDFREATEEDQAAGYQCSTCEYFDAGECGLLETAVEGDDLCDAWTDEEYEEAATEVASLIVNGAIDLDEHNAQPHGPPHKGRRRGREMDGRRHSRAYAAYQRSRRKQHPFGEADDELEEHNAVPHGPGHGGKKAGPMTPGRPPGRGNDGKAAAANGVSVETVHNTKTAIRDAIDGADVGADEPEFAAQMETVYGKLDRGTKLTNRERGTAAEAAQFQADNMRDMGDPEAGRALDDAVSEWENVPANIYEAEADLEEHNVVPHGPGHGGKKGGGPRQAARDEKAYAATGLGMARHELKGGKKFGDSAEGRAEARKAIQNLRPGDTVRAGTRQFGGGVHNSNAVVVRTQTGGRTFTARERNGKGAEVTFEADHLASLALTRSFDAPAPAGPVMRRARAGADPIRHMYDSDRAEPLGDLLLENALPIGVEQLLEGLRKDGTFPVKIITPGWGTSGYYAPEVLKRAADAGRFPSGLRMFWDHPTKSEASERPERSLRDLAAVTTSKGVYRDDGPDGPGVYAEAKAFEQFKPYIEELAPHIGVSMRGYGGTKTGEAEGKKGALVEDIIAVQSADFVTQAGRGGKILQLFEAARTGEPFTVGDLQEESDMPELTELQESLATSNVTIARLQEQIAYRDAKDMAKELVGASGLPPVTQKRLVETLLDDVPLGDETRTLDQDKFKEGVEAAIKAEREYIQALGGPVVKGLGEAAPTLEEAGSELEHALAGIMGDPAKAKVAAQGRAN